MLPHWTTRRSKYVLVPVFSLIFSAGIAPAGIAETLGGDLNGDGIVDQDDESWLLASLGSSAVDPLSPFEPAADLDRNGVVDVRDAALLGAAFGTSGGDVDTSPPNLLVTLNDVPDDMNDLLVAPPDAFQITLQLDGGGGSAIDPTSLSVTSSEDIGPLAAGTELASWFTVTPTRAVWEVPAGADLARTSHFLNVSVRDAAGNEVDGSYGYAVRDFAYGAPLADLQTIFLDFEQDRSLGPETDFTEDLRAYGLSSAAKPMFENSARYVISALIVERVNAYYTQNGPGSAPDPVNVVFTETLPTGSHSRLCVGGESSSGPLYLGATIQDDQNLNEASDNCHLAAAYGVFPQAIRALWGANAEFQAVFAPFDVAQGGTPLGEDPADPYILSLASEGELEDLLLVSGRPSDIANAVGAFVQVVATAIAHEAGHMLGLTAQGDAPAGLFGGTAGASTDHNVTATGSVPTANYIMNRGNSFTFEEMSGRQGTPLPVFRELNWAYLHDRVALNDELTSLEVGPQLHAIAPDPAVYSGPFTPLTLTITGENFQAQPTQPSVQLIVEGDPTPNVVTGVQVIDSQTITGQIHPLLVPAALYDVRVLNPDGQEVVVADFLDVQTP